MRNVIMTVDNDVLTIKVDLKAKAIESSSGKSLVIASTEGNVNVTGQDEIKIGLNIYTKKQ